MASQTKIDVSTTLNLITLGNNNKVVFEYVGNGRYISTENTEENPLVANRSTIGPEETFKIDNVNGSIALKA